MESVKKRLADIKNKLVISDLLNISNNQNYQANQYGNEMGESSGLSPREASEKSKSKDLLPQPMAMASPQTSFKTITVQISDSILSLSRKYNMSEESLVILNRLGKDTSLYPGQRLVVGSDASIPDLSNIQTDAKDYLNYRLLLPRLREIYDFVTYNKDVNTLNGYSDIQHYESELEKTRNRKNTYQLDNIIYLIDDINQNQSHLNGYIILKNDVFTFVPSNLSFSFHKFEFNVDILTAWNLTVDNRVNDGEQVDSQRLLLKIYLKSYVDNSFKKFFQIHIDKSNEEQLFKELESSLALYFKKEMTRGEINEDQIYKPPSPQYTSSIWDKLSKPIPYYTSTNPLSKSTVHFNSGSPELIGHNTEDNNNSSNSNIETINKSPPPSTYSSNFPLSPLLSIARNEEIYKFGVHYCCGQIKVFGNLTLLPSRVIFQGDVNDPTIKKEGSLKYQLHFTLDTILSCLVIPKIKTTTLESSITDDDLQFNMDGSDQQQPSKEDSISSMTSSKDADEEVDGDKLQSIHMVIVENQSGSDSLIEKDIIFEGSEDDIQQINKLLKEWLGHITPMITPSNKHSSSMTGVTTTPGASTNTMNSSNNSNTKTPLATSITSNLMALSTSVVDKFLDLAMSSGMTNENSMEDEIEDEYKLITDFNPEFIGESTLFKVEEIKPLLFYLPTMCCASNWVLLYKSELHGISINTLYSKTKEKGPCLLFVKDTNYNIFGGFISESLRPSPPKTYYGTGETFLFTIRPQFEVFLCSKENQCFVQSTDTYISMGGGSNGKYGLWLDSDLCHGCTCQCITYDSKPLSTSEDFQILDLEIWGFQ